MENFVLSACPLFAGLTPDQAQSALACLAPVRRQYPAGDFVLHAGQPLPAVGLVAAGAVQIIQEDAWGNRNILQTLPAGQLFGESYACLPGQPLAVSAVAARPAQVLFLRVEKLLGPGAAACPHHARLALNLLAILAQKNLLLTQKIYHVTQKTTRQKLMAYLSYQATVQNRRQFDIPFDRQQLADYLAVERSALSAEMGRMRRAGLIKYHKNHFWLPPQP